MKELKLTMDETMEMRQFYMNELEAAERKARHLRSVLSKLGEDMLPEAAISGAAEVSAKIVAEKPKAKRKRRRKRGRKSLWGNFILKLLKEKQQPLTYNQIIFSAVDRFNLPPEKHKNVKQSITNSAFRLRAINHKIDTFGFKGKKEKYLCLSSWYDDSGNLKADYLKAISK